MEIHETDEEQLPVFMLSRGVAPGHAMRNAPSSPQLAIRSPSACRPPPGSAAAAGPRCHLLPGPFTRRFHALRALGVGKRRRFPFPPRRCPQLPPAPSGDHGADPGRPPRPGPRGHGHPRARAPSLSSARKASRRRSRRGARSRWPRVRALAVTRAAARMGRDSESRSTNRGLESSSSSARSSAMAAALRCRTPRPAALARAAHRLAIGCAPGGRAARARGAGRRRGAAGPGGVGLSSAGRGRTGLCGAGLGWPRLASGGAAMSSGGTLSILRSDSYAELSQYRDQHFRGTRYDQERLLRKSCTLYVGNLSFYTTEEQIHELFGKSGDIKKVIMGLDKVKKTACGFCFVEYYARGDAENAMRYINGTRLDDRIIRTDWDAGFKEGRQYGRGRSGGQVRDEYRQDYDAGRGGYGKTVQCQ
ncbi:uncharacterized protein LOC115907038 [Camarhynchus parvulus]|nr:uncharacterized protein LOC115907038 [Camarhynchus parvulus]